LRRQPDDHNFDPLIMLAVTVGGVLMVIWVATKALFFLPQNISDPLKADWQRHVLAFNRRFRPWEHLLRTYWLFFSFFWVAWRAVEELGFDKFCLDCN
jgi:hypothetical protein